MYKSLFSVVVGLRTMQVKVVAVGSDLCTVWVDGAVVGDEGDSERLTKLMKVLNVNVRGEPIVVRSATKDVSWTHMIVIDASSPARRALLSGQPVELAGGKVVAFEAAMLTGVTGSTITLFIKKRVVGV